ncbi:hypothetical protein VHUM_02151 [Vanrija humicola]|uniref:Uncharacterized protein n=1 Tax=Vanrija humicola TaxID=5417 RepID=A0A7D8V1S4_VANHU|nr:hypothetical protein VHUM_02151 [Vanrija humicola]
MSLVELVLPKRLSPSMPASARSWRRGQRRPLQTLPPRLSRRWRRGRRPNPSAILSETLSDHFETSGKDKSRATATKCLRCVPSKPPSGRMWPRRARRS